MNLSQIKIVNLQRSSQVSINMAMQQIIAMAIETNASDIHIPPLEDMQANIKFRIDGIITKIKTINTANYNKLIIHLKVLANLDITCHNLPQDGRFSMPCKDGNIDCRINFCPCIYGQNIVIRILINKIELTLAELGMLPQQEAAILKKIKQKHGLVLVAGPTGSGKTITLYSMLKILSQQNLNIITVCDPVEVMLTGISQTNVSSQLGYREILTTFLRQDPDVIMIGEIRDYETLKIAIQAASTGHLVLSSIHADNANGTLSRLKHMGANLSEINTNIELIIAQRLIRKLCKNCHGGDDNCLSCNKGYKGQQGVFEMIQAPIKVMENKLVGSYTMLDAAKRLLAKTITDIKELQRVFAKEC